MWTLLNQTPFSAERGFYRDRQGREVWVSVVRASFEVGEQGRLRRAERQTHPQRAPVWRGEPGRSSLLDDSDFQRKSGTDLLILGDALAPGGKPVRHLDVGWRLGALSKTLRVHGERVWERAPGGSAVVPGPAHVFERVPLVYEKAFGGQDREAPPQGSASCTPNPVGSGFCRRPEVLLGTPAPQLEYPGVSLVAAAEQLAPPGFGPIAPHWQPRVGLAGTYDEAWQASRAPLPPADFDEAFFRVAPADQQLPRFLQGGESIEVEHMTPEGSWRVRLPELGLSATTVFSDGSESSAATLQTVRLLPNERRVELSWLATTACQGREHKLLRARVTCTGERSWQ